MKSTKELFMKQYKILALLIWMSGNWAAPRPAAEIIVLPDIHLSELDVTDEINTGNLKVSNIAEIHHVNIEELTVTNNARLCQDVFVCRDLSIGRNETIDNNLIVSGTTTFVGPITGSSLSLTGDATVDGNLSVGGTSDFSGDVLIDANLSVTGNETVDGNLGIGGTSDFSGDVLVDANLSVTGDETVDGDFTLGGAFVGSGPVGFPSLSVTNDVTIGCELI